MKALSPVKPNQVTLIVSPPHLIEKWKREILSIHPNTYVEQLDRHEDVKAFMEKAERLGDLPKVGLMKRDMTKLGSPREVAVVWRTVGRALWHHRDSTPHGYTPQQRIVRDKTPHCPQCGSVVLQNSGDSPQIATEGWLKAGKRTCNTCNSPLWQAGRDSSSKPRDGEKFPTKNPRIRLDDYLKRHYRNRIALLIWDEIHEAQHSDTGNGVAFGKLAGIAQKVLAMTGTPFNGRSSSLFNLEYHINERVRQHYPWGGAPRYARKARGTKGFPERLMDTSKQRGRAESRWVDVMGVREQVVEERPTYDSETGAYTGTTTYQRPYTEAPGISPLLVAEVLDHAIFISLGDLDKALPDYEEIAMPVVPDEEVATLYRDTQTALKDYLIQRRWEGDSSFRGAYLQWAMGWPSSAHMPYEIVHNLKDRFSNQKRRFTVRQLPSLGTDRIYAKEQALINLVQEELAQNRSCVVYLRQTQTRDLQPRLSKLLTEHVPEARVYILKNTVSAERREAVIEREVRAGANVILCNPELVKTGLDLVFASTLIYYEISFNLSTMMQASARSYRLNQTQKLCKVCFLFYEGTMEHHAVQLMSRKQRAAKLLNGEIGLTGLEELTKGESGLEEALLQAIGQEESLIDPSELFKTDSLTHEIDTEDKSFWNVEQPSSPASEPAPLPFSPPALRVLPQPDSRSESLHRALTDWLQRVTSLPQERLTRVQARVGNALENGMPNPADSTLKLFEGVAHPDFARYATHADHMTRWLVKYLRSEKVASPDSLDALARDVVALAQKVYATPSAKARQANPSPTKTRKKPDLLAVPDDAPALPPRVALTQRTTERPQQLTLFVLPPLHV